MAKQILIIEDESLVALDLELILTGAGYSISGIAASVKEALELMESGEPDMVLLDIFLKGAQNGIDLARILSDRNIPFIYISANFQASILEKAKTTQPYGFLVKPFREDELLVTLDVAFYRHSNGMESKLRQERALGDSLMQIVAGAGLKEQKISGIVKEIQPYVPFDFISIITKSSGEFAHDGIMFLRVGFDEYQTIGTPEFLNISRIAAEDLKKMQALTKISTQAQLQNNESFNGLLIDYPVKKVIAKTFQLRSYLGFPLLLSNGEVVQISFYSRKPDGYSTDHLDLLNRLQRRLTTAIESIMGNSEFEIPVRQQINPARENGKNTKGETFAGIIGKSHPMLTVLDNVKMIAPLDTSVLILGESGTGKEAIAKSIHQLSPRNNNALVTVNCASLPASLIESELFGHEKGAFTGATEKRIGKFELAHKGTIFLDEIGEMPVELQMKLLRVLQEHEVERIGGKAPVKVDVRIIAATNRNLEKEVEEGRFRLDLYYRLYVFPIMVPPLRERGDDIQLLAGHFMELYSRKCKKNVTGFSQESMAQLKAYRWPGNVRELEHLIERSVLFAKGTEIKELMMPSFNKKATDAGDTGDRTLKSIEENSRDHILAVLQKCDGRISGPGGAAEILKVPPSTLHSKIRKLGIKKWTI